LSLACIGRAAAVVTSTITVVTLTLSLGGVAAIADPTSSSTAPTPTTTTPTSPWTSQPSATTTKSQQPTPPSSSVSTADRADLAIQTKVETSLALSPKQGGPGTPVTITAVGYAPCLDPPPGDVEKLSGFPVFSLEWDHQAVDVSQASVKGPNVVAQYTVPYETSAGDHSVTVTVSCSLTFVGRSKPEPIVVHNDATFTVIAPKKDPTLKLDTPAGHRGTQIRATGTDFACGSSESVQLFWDGTGDPLTDPQPQTFSVQFTVPEVTPTGGHHVVARCQYHSTITASEPFEVTQNKPPVVTPPPTLTVQPTSGHPGDPMRISGERFVCTDNAGTVDVRWDADTSLATPPVDAAGHFEMSTQVPSDADPGGHSVHASCADKSVAMVTTFTVVATDVPPPPVPAAAIALQPASGHRGDPMRIAGEGFACADRTVQLSWDDGTRLAAPPVDASGGFATSVPVPTNAELRSHPVTAACSDASVTLTAAFTVLAEPAPPPHTPIWGWVIALILVGAAVFVVRHIYRRLHPRPPHVHAVSRIDGPPLVAVHETPAHGESTCALRLETHTGARTLTVDEVNDDHTPIE
jgi:hypothetical protein